MNTIGSELEIKVEAPHQVVRDMIEDGQISAPKQEDLDRWAEEEFISRTSGGWSEVTCPACFERFSHAGTCSCPEDLGEMERAVKVLRMAGLID